MYTQISPSMEETAVKIMIELLSVLALATTQIKEGRFRERHYVRTLLLAYNRLGKYGKLLLGEDDVVSVLQRLDRLTVEESRITVAQTMEAVHGLVSNMKEVMESS
jgi:hypothetical protein